VLWRISYNEPGVEQDTVEGKEKAFKSAKATLLRFPYAMAFLHKFKGNEKIYVATYELDLKAYEKGTVRLKKIM